MPMESKSPLLDGEWGMGMYTCIHTHHIFDGIRHNNTGSLPVPMSYFLLQLPVSHPLSVSQPKAKSREWRQISICFPPFAPYLLLDR